MQKLFYPVWSWKNFAFFLIGTLLLFTSCTTDNVSPAGKSSKPRVKKVIQFCDKASEEDSCKKNSSCKKDCDKIFSEKENEKKCQALPTNTVKAFKTLIQQTKDKDEIQEITPKTLGCFLQIDPEEFAELVKNTSRQATKNFLVAIAENKALAEALENKDDDFDVLEELFEKAVGGKNLYRVLTRSIEDGKTFLQIASAERNQPAFYYLDNYVDLRCEDESTFCGDKEESLVAYCRALVRFSDSDLEDFLDSADYFEEEYSGEVESAGFDYDEDGFRDFCSSSSGSSSSSGGGSSGGSDGSPPSSPQTPTGICSRNSLVQTAILAKIPGKTQCSAVTSSDLSGITGTLHIPSGIRGSDVGTGRLGSTESAMTTNDFKGLSGITTLDLNSHKLHTILSATTLLSDLTSLTHLRLTESEISCSDVKNLLKSLPNSANSLTRLGLGETSSGGVFCYCPSGGKFIDSDLQTHLGGTAYSCTNGGEECTLTRSGDSLRVDGDYGYCQ